jgi:hypothetical protein
MAFGTGTMLNRPRLRTYILALIAALWIAPALLCAAVPAVAGWQSRDSNYNQNIVAAGGGYTGPGDIVSGAYAWYSCARGYNAADTANACNVCLPSDTTCADITLTAGLAVLPGSLSTCNITTVICTVKTAYDKSGNGRNITQATEANRPTFRPAMASNGCPSTALPCMLFTAASSQRLVSSGTHTITAPITASIVYSRISGAASELFPFPGGVATIFPNNPANSVALDASSVTANTTVADGAFHALQGVLASASAAAIYADGSSATGLNAGTVTISGVNIRIGGPPFLSGYFNGYVSEAGFWANDFSSGVSCGSQSACASAMNTNQHGSNGYNF